jgi:hypothetical protein
MLVIRLADDARLAMMRTVAMRGVMAVEAEHAQAAIGKRIGARAAHCAESNNDHIVRARHARSAGIVGLAQLCGHVTAAKQTFGALLT